MAAIAEYTSEAWNRWTEERVSMTALPWPKGRWRNFSRKEMACRETDECWLDADFMDLLQDLREGCHFPLTVSSGYRSPDHSEEKDKDLPGAHTYGKAVDLVVGGHAAYVVLRWAMELGFSGIGVKQTGDDRFLHLDTLKPEDGLTPHRPTVWSY